MIKPVFTFIFSALLLVYACTLPERVEPQPYPSTGLLCEFPVTKPVLIEYSDDLNDITKYQMIVQNDVVKNQYIKKLEDKIKAICGVSNGVHSSNRQEEQEGTSDADNKEKDNPVL